MDQDELPDWKAELRREHGLNAAPSLRRGSAPLDEPEPAEQTWTEVMLLEAGVAPLARPSDAIAAAIADAQPVKAWSCAAGFDPSQVPTTFEAYTRLLHKVQDPARDRLAAALAPEPYLRAGFRTWPTASRQERLNILYEVFPRLSQATAQHLRFKAAAMGMGEPHAVCPAYYSERQRRVMLSTDMLEHGFKFLVDIIVHEQIHKLQHEMYLRMNWASTNPLSLDERALVLYWVREEPRYRRLVAAALADPDRRKGHAAYRRIGREYHAMDVGGVVAAACARAAGRPG